MNLTFQGWNSHVLREFPINVESRNLGRDNLSGEIGRKASGELRVPRHAHGERGRRGL